MNEDTTQEEGAPESSLTTPQTSEKVKDKQSCLQTLLGSRRRRLIASMLVLLLAGTGVAAYLLLIKDDARLANSQTEDNAAAVGVSEQGQEEPILAASPINVTYLDDNTYFESPKVLPNLNIYKNPEEYFGTFSLDGQLYEPQVRRDNIEYRHIGTTKDGRDIIVYHIFEGTTRDVWHVLLRKNGSYEYLSQVNDPGLVAAADRETGYVPTLTAALSPNVTLNLTDFLDTMRFSENVMAKSQKLRPLYGIGYYLPKGLASLRTSYYGDSQAQSEFIEEKDGIKFYRVLARDESHYQVSEIYGVRAGVFAMQFNLNGELTKTGDPVVLTWTSGEASTKGYITSGPGCGSSGYVIAKNISKEQLLEKGKTPQGQKVYQLSTAHPLVQEIYKEDYDGNGDWVEDVSLKNLTIEQFNDKHAYFLVENGFNEWTVFLRGDMIVRGGCGKPVIYLYPTKEQNVSVQVGADVVLSEPFYETNGWQSVLARPDGRLTYRGADYDSLYWEGYGHGQYPDTSGVGTVVKRSDAPGAIRRQLAQQGLNQKETDDFMAFWEAKLPTTPYVRLSWLSNRQLDELAPLTVRPLPQTSIRVFLEFEGLSDYQQLKEQRFIAPPRKGFTLVEWGGLLREGIRR